MEYEAVIGLEVHAQLLTKSKIFCSCSTEFGADANSETCPVCLGMPGVLPVLNREVVEYTIKTALATRCAIAPDCRFARKNYFYPDLPKGYQISQYEEPLCQNGHIEINVDGQTKRIGITRIHMEEDAGKLIHGENLGDINSSYVDLNRTGVPLMEIVSEPDMNTPEEAREYLLKLKAILEYLEVCDGNMEKGSLRCDANVSIRPKGNKELGTKTELKNMNSFRNVQKALEYEIQRQIDVLDDGGKILQETRLWDGDKGVTVSMRGKEEAHDYRYFPEPDLVRIRIGKEWIEEVRKKLPELPEEKKARFVTQYKIPEYDAGILTSSKPLADYYEKCVELYPNPKVVSNWVMGDILRELKAANIEINDCPLRPENLAGMLKLMDKGVISGKIAKTVFEEMYKTGKPAGKIVEEKGLTQITDEDELSRTIDEILDKNSKEVEQYRQGKEKLIGFFVGEAMKATRGKANPQLVNQLLKEKLKP
jgi:aspartyl-tRNA(Asn)/glutamyl-tRNA(Gln) amidotransferase subunit B